MEVRAVYYPGLDAAQLKEADWWGRIESFVCIRRVITKDNAQLKDGQVQILENSW